MDPVLAVILVLVSAFLAGELMRFMHLPQVLGYLLAGFLLASVRVVAPLEIFDFLKELGVVFLFFFIGLGIDTAKFREEAGRSIRLGAWTSVLPFLVGMLAAMVLGLDLQAGIVLAICLSVSAQAACVMVLEETRLLKSKLGRDIVEAGIVADVLQLVGISVLFGLLPLEGTITLQQLLVNWALFMGVIFTVKLMLFPLFERRVKSVITIFSGCVILALVMGYLAEMLGLGSILGALFAGVLIRQFFAQKVVRALTDDFYKIGFGFLVPILFVWTGYQSLVGISWDWAWGVGLAVLTIVGSIAGALVALKESLKHRIMAGIALATKGDVEVVLATVMLEAGVISLDLFAMIIVMSVTTMVLAPALFYGVKTWK